MKVEQVVVGPCQVRFPNLEQHEQFDGVSTGKYSCTFLFDSSSASVGVMKKGIAEANGGKGNNPLSQIAADAEYDAGMYKVKGKSKFVVKVLDKQGNPVDVSTVGQGATVQAVLGFAPYTQGGGGVTTYLNAIKILEGGSQGSTDMVQSLFGELPDGYEKEEPLPF